MTDILLVGAIALVFVVGYPVIKKIFQFMDKNYRSKYNEKDNFRR